MEYAPHIADIMAKMNRDLLLVLKSNNYLRTIDMKLGSPGNNLRIVNKYSWDIYCSEILPNKPNVSYLSRFRQISAYYFLRLLMFGY